MTAPSPKTRALHPLAREAARRLARVGGELTLPRGAGAQIKNALAEIVDDRQLEWAVRSLVLAASRLDARGAKTAASALLEIASSAAQAIWRLVSTRGNERRVVTANRLLGARRDPTPRPVLAAPTVRVGALFSPSRISPR